MPLENTNQYSKVQENVATNDEYTSPVNHPLPRVCRDNACKHKVLQTMAMPMKSEATCVSYLHVY